MPERTRFMVLAPVVRGRKGEYGKLFKDLAEDGYARVRVDGELHELPVDLNLDKNYKHDVDVVVDRLVIREGIERRLTDSIETALRLSEGLVLVETVERDGSGADGDSMLFSESFTCTNCGASIAEIQPRTFSFNSPHGACDRCDGLGSRLEIDPELVGPQRGPERQRGCRGAVGQLADGVPRERSREPRGEVRDRPQRAVARAARGAPAPDPARHRGRQDLRLLPQSVRPSAAVHDALRRGDRQPRAALRRDGLRVPAREDRGVHEPRAVPEVQGREAAPRGAGRHRRSEERPRVHGDERQARAGVLRRGRVHPAGVDHRRAGRQGDPGTPRFLGGRRASAT